MQVSLSASHLIVPIVRSRARSYEIRRTVPYTNESDEPSVALTVQRPT